MSDSQPPPSPPSPHVPLEYEHSETRPSAGLLIGQCFFSTILTVIALMGVGFFYFLYAFSVGESGSNTQVAGWVGIAVAVVFLGLANLAAFRTYRYPRRRGIAMGIWIGLGIGLLLEGLCFGVL